MPARLITLTTDFGLSDHFVGAMKGIILGLVPSARIVDITHNIAPYNIAEAAFVIREAWPCFPLGTIHVVIVDPGVGSDRRPILVETSIETGDQFFIGPDNGVFSMIYDATPHKVRMLSNPKLMRAEISRTFHGRDVFAPTAAHLARGVKPSQFGKRIQDYARLPLAAPQRLAEHTYCGTILKVDHFGNLITNFHQKKFESLKTRPFEFRAGSQYIRRLALNYAETSPGELFVIDGSSGYFEIAINQASAAQKLELTAGSPIELRIYW